jgi:hypothetical protein
MGNSQFAKRIDGLSEKLKDNSEEMIKIDYDSFSEAEKLLFAKVDKIEAEYRQKGSAELLAKNADLIYKNIEIIQRRVTELFCYITPLALGCDGTQEIAKYFFDLHFYNFQVDLSECLRNFRSKWDKKDVDEFLLDLKKNGSPLFRIPRGFNEYNSKELSAFCDSTDLEENIVENQESK